MLVHRRVTPSIKFAGTHLYTWVERGTVRVKCLAQEHNTMSPARARTWTVRSGDERTNHETTAPPTWATWSIVFPMGYIKKLKLKSNQSKLLRRACMVASSLWNVSVQSQTNLEGGKSWAQEERNLPLSPFEYMCILRACVQIRKKTNSYVFCRRSCKPLTLSSGKRRGLFFWKTDVMFPQYCSACTIIIDCYMQLTS